LNVEKRLRGLQSINLRDCLKLELDIDPKLNVFVSEYMRLFSGLHMADLIEESAKLRTSVAHFPRHLLSMDMVDLAHFSRLAATACTFTETYEVFVATSFEGLDRSRPEPQLYTVSFREEHLSEKWTELKQVSACMDELWSHMQSLWGLISR